MPTAILNTGNPDVIKIGCRDPLANNYDVFATQSCTDCCTYNTPTTGCKDPFASNYDSKATLACTNCCIYGRVQSSSTSVSNFDTFSFGTLKPTAQSSDSNTSECPIETICIDCKNLDWWNDLYIKTHNGQSLSTTSPQLWQSIVNLIVNSGVTVTINPINGESLTKECCDEAGGFWDFRNNVCLCVEIPIVESYTGTCISTIAEFLSLIETRNGYEFFEKYFSLIGPSLGLTPTQTQFVIDYIDSSGDSDGDGIPDSTEATLIVSNALDATGGFYVNFGVYTNTPVMVTKSECEAYGGFWDGDPEKGTCMCAPIVSQCEIDLTQVQTINSFDFFNNPIQIVTLKPGTFVQTTGTTTSLNEDCCNRLIKDNPNLGWVWQAPYCLTKPKEDCLPVTFGLNNEPMEVSCQNDLELSMWVYFEKPKNPCQPIPDAPVDGDVIVIEGQYCDVTLTPNTFEPIGGVPKTKSDWEAKPRPRFEAESGPSKKPCCYNTSYPIKARITTTDNNLNTSLIQDKIYNSATDYFNRWVQIKTKLPSSNTPLNFSVKLEIYEGLNCCCNYDFYIDDIRVDCPNIQTTTITNNIECPGFKFNRVIDNKKSWAYNPGLPSVGISTYDEIERLDGSFGSLNGEGSINRTFAPSLDADIRWRYTDYWKQSSVRENHSNLVLNSKELWLTFDMCAKCPISGTTLVCPQGFTLSANTNVCYQIESDQKLFQDGINFIFMDGDNYIFQFQN